MIITTQWLVYKQILNFDHFIVCLQSCKQSQPLIYLSLSLESVQSGQAECTRAKCQGSSSSGESGERHGSAVSDRSGRQTARQCQTNTGVTQKCWD